MPRLKQPSRDYSKMVKKRWDKATNDEKETPCDSGDINMQNQINIRKQKKMDSVATIGHNECYEEHLDDIEYILIDFSQLSPLLSKAKCADCNQSTLAFELNPTCWGFSRKILLKCSYCELSGNESVKSHVYSSKRCYKESKERAPFDVNTRMTLAFVYAGKGYSCIEQFSMIMSIQSYSCKTFQDNVKYIESAVDETTKVILDECRDIVKNTYKKCEFDSESELSDTEPENESEMECESESNNNNSDGDLEMKCDSVHSDTDSDENLDMECDSDSTNNNLSVESSKLDSDHDSDFAGFSNNSIQTQESDNKVNLGVSYDGSWPTKGFQSKVGFGSVIDLITGYIIDFEVVTKFCQTCVSTAAEFGADSPEFYFWWQGHADQCSISHTGSSGAMETTIAEIIWKRSENLGFRFVKMLSDGDSKAYTHVASLNVYGNDYEIEKEECVNHVAKRFYSGAIKLVKEERSRKITLGGRGHGQLKEATIKKLSEYYKKAIYNNKGNIKDMEEAIYASLYHCASTDKSPQHSRCPTGESSWCFFQSALAKKIEPGTHANNVKTPINQLCFEKILPLYARLTDESLLRRCARCLTQNANESLHSVIWSRCPKETYVSAKRVKLAASISVCEYNVGTQRFISEVMVKLGLKYSGLIKQSSIKKDTSALHQSELRNTEKYKEVRRKIDFAKSQREQALLEREGVSYGAGLF